VAAEARRYFERAADLAGDGWSGPRSSRTLGSPRIVPPTRSARRLLADAIAVLEAAGLRRLPRARADCSPAR
jgi:hypothetical protein